MGRLLLLFILIPAIELGLLIELGSHIGTLATLGLILFTGVLGANLTRRQGMSVLNQVRSEVNRGRIPTDSLADGVMILLAGALLITPGILTDLVGFSCLIPAVRRFLKKRIWTHLQRALRAGRVQVVGNIRTGAGPSGRAGPTMRPAGKGPTIDIDVED